VVNQTELARNPGDRLQRRDRQQSHSVSSGQASRCHSPAELQPWSLVWTLPGKESPT